MAKFLLAASYAAEGVQGVASEGGTSRRAAVEQAIVRLGGTVEAFYFASGDNDVFVMPTSRTTWPLRASARPSTPRERSAARCSPCY